MTSEEALKELDEWREQMKNHGVPDYGKKLMALDMAIEALKAKCPTCKRCSDHQESGTRCPIEEHYLLPKDGYCHLYEPYRKEKNNE